MRSILFVLPLLGALLVGGAVAANAEAHKAVLLMAAQGEEGTVVSFGRDAQEPGPLERSIRAPFEKAGIEFVSARDAAVSSMGDALQGLPLGDASASSVARASGASIAIIVGIVAKHEGGIRATSLVGESVSARLRVLDVSTARAIFDGKGKSASYGRESTMARSQAIASAIAKATRGMLAKVIQRWPKTQVAHGQLSLIITGAEGWRSVAVILRSLSATRGVSDLHAVQIQPDRVTLSLRSQQGAAQVVASLRRARIHNGSLSVQLSGTSLLVGVIMSTPSILPPSQ
ncbi:MAG: hypothetical protein GY811_05020 [Myxococcales bacterium]|nr:hypothetical protein [Myxococcales bacterium]